MRTILQACPAWHVKTISYEHIIAWRHNWLIPGLSCLSCLSCPSCPSCTMLTDQDTCRFCETLAHKAFIWTKSSIPSYHEKSSSWHLIVSWVFRDAFSFVSSTILTPNHFLPPSSLCVPSLSRKLSNSGMCSPIQPSGLRLGVWKKGLWPDRTGPNQTEPNRTDPKRTLLGHSHCEMMEISF